ncbi:MAG: GNAT family N-acetyltransferase [Candidatus Aureabacteria bacterium]|nr:GNAT family N-acetyltransferase [Candidatus Auribacterota bacterium]
MKKYFLILIFISTVTTFVFSSTCLSPKTNKSTFDFISVLLKRYNDSGFQVFFGDEIENSEFSELIKKINATRKWGEYDEDVIANKSRTLVLYRNNVPVAYISYVDNGHVDLIATDKNANINSGVLYLILELVDHFGSIGITKLTLHYREENFRLKSLYFRLFKFVKLLYGPVQVDMYPNGDKKMRAELDISELYAIKKMLSVST